MSWPLTVWPMLTSLAMLGLSAAACSYSLLDAAGAAVRVEHLVALGGQRGSHAAATVWPPSTFLGFIVDALRAQLPGLGPADDRLDADLRPSPRRSPATRASSSSWRSIAEVDDLGDLAGSQLADVDVEAVPGAGGTRRRPGRARRQQAGREGGDGEDGQHCSVHRGPRTCTTRPRRAVPADGSARECAPICSAGGGLSRLLRVSPRRRRSPRRGCPAAAPRAAPWPAGRRPAGRRAPAG